MANDNTVNVEITASVAGLKSGLSQAEKGIKGFGTSTDKMTSKTNKMAGAVKANAVPSLTSFSQVIQDAPYGIRGVANNITQLTSQFGYLAKSSGGAGNALKAMIGSLTGPAGILLAVSLVTSLLVSYGDELANIGSESAKAAKKQEELTKSLEDYEKSLSAVNKANLQGSKDAVKELTNLRLLKAQVDNTNLSNKKRIEAVKELQKKYPSYLGNITNEDALVGGLDTKYNELSTAILKTAKAQAASKLISENYQKQLVLEAQLQDNAVKISQDKAKAEAFASQAIVQSQTITGSGTKSNIELNKKYNSQVESGLKTQSDLVSEITRLQNDSLNLSKQITENGGIVPLNFGGDGGDAPKPDDIARPIVEAIQGSKAIVDATATGYFTNWKNILLGTLGTAKNELAPITTAISSQIENAIPTTTISEKAQQLKDIFSQLGEDIKGVTQSGIYETIANMSFALGDALGSGGNALKAVGQAMLGTLGDILIQFGELSLAAGIAATALGQALRNPLNPANAAAAIAAGAALIAIGGAVKAFSSSIGGKSASEADSGSYSGSSNTDYSSSANYSSSSGGGGTYVFEIAGTKLIGVLKNTLDRNKQLGGSNNLIFG